MKTLLEETNHLEDLSVDDFVDTIETLAQKSIVERLDAYNLWFGLDNKGRFFTTMEGRNNPTEVYYDVKDYKQTASYNDYRSVHKALQECSKEIKTLLIPGDTLKCQFLLDENKGNIVIINGFEEVPLKRVDDFKHHFNNKTISVSTVFYYSEDGSEIKSEKKTIEWDISSVKPVSSKNLKLKTIHDKLEDMQKWLSFKNDVVDITNYELIKTNLNSYPKASREKIKKEREKCKEYVLSNFKLPIKQELFEKLSHRISPKLTNQNLIDEDKISGVVLTDEKSGKQVKITDRDILTAINAFTDSIKANVSTVVRTVDDKAEIEMRGGVFGVAKIKIATLIGNTDLARSASAKKYFAKFNKETLLADAVKDLHLSNYQTIKQDVISILDKALTDIEVILNDFKEDVDEFKLTLKSGKYIGLSKQDMQKTLATFAEVKKEIKIIVDNISKANSNEDILMVLYGKQINDVQNLNEDFMADYMNFGNPETPYVLQNDSLEQDDYNPFPGATTSHDIMPVPKIFNPWQNTTKESKKGKSRNTMKIQKNKTKKFKNGRLVDSTLRNSKNVYGFILPTGYFIDYDHADNNGTQETIIESFELKDRTHGDYTALKKEVNELRAKILTTDRDVVTNQLEIMNYIKKLGLLSKEVDTVEYGLRLKNGEVYVVHINVDDADKFEQIVKDIEHDNTNFTEIIADILQDVDIVDIEKIVDATEKDVEEIEANSKQVEALEKEKEEEREEDVSTPESSEETPETDKEDETPTDSKEDEDNSFTGDFNEKGEDLNDDEDDSSIGADEEFETHLNELLNESAELTGEDITNIDEAIKVLSTKSIATSSLLKSFTSKPEKLAIGLFLAFGIPTKMIIANKSLFRTNIQAFCEHIKENTFALMWAKKLIVELEKVELLKEEFEQNVANYSYGKKIFQIMQFIGFPRELEQKYTTALVKIVANLSKEIQENNYARIVMNSLFRSIDKKDFLLSQNLNEDIAYDETTHIVFKLLEALGLDIKSYKSIEKQFLVPMVRSHITRIVHNSNIRTRLESLLLLIQKAENIRDVEQLEESTEEGNWNIYLDARKNLVLISNLSKIIITKDEVETIKEGLKQHKDFTIEGFKFEAKNDSYSITSENNKHFDLTKIDIQNLANFLD